MWCIKLLRKIILWAAVIGILISVLIMISGILELYALSNYTGH